MQINSDIYLGDIAVNGCCYGRDKILIKEIILNTVVNSFGHLFLGKTSFI